MDWVLDNLDNVIIPIIIMILYGLGSVAQKKGKNEKKPLRRGPQQGDPEETRRVAEIQEEIRRKIAERTGRVAPAPPPLMQSAPPSPPPRPRAIQPKRVDQFPDQVRRASPPAPSGQGFQVEAYQRDIAAKLNKVRELEARVKSKPLPEIWGTRKQFSHTRLRGQLFRDLADPIGQKKAILLSEILGSPVGIKGPAGWKSNS